MTFCKSTCQAVLDSGTNNIGVPREDVLRINSFIDAKEYFNNRYIVSKKKKEKIQIINIYIIYDWEDNDDIYTEY